METQTLDIQQTERNPFIESNTLPVTLQELENDHIIPVFTRNNQPLISQAQFIQMVHEKTQRFLASSVTNPDIRVSHPIKGRIPSAMHKAAADLEPHEKTIYYQRMMFICRVPDLSRQVNGQEMDFIVGGVKAYNLDNITGQRESLQHFKLFSGYQVSVCANLCVWTDGAKLDVKVNSLDHLGLSFEQLLEEYDPNAQIETLSKFQDLTITERQFAQLVGRCRMYPHLSSATRRGIPSLALNDSQIGRVVKGFYEDQHFGSANGEIDLWNLHNLFTDSNRSSYVDSALDKAVNVSNFTSQLADALSSGSDFWHLN